MFFSVADFWVILKRVASMDLSKVLVPLPIMERLSRRFWGIDRELFEEFIRGV